MNAKKLISFLILLLSVNAFAETAAEFKARIKAMSDTEIKALLDVRNNTGGEFTSPHGNVAKIWSGIGACMVSDATSCASCACDFYFKSNHPNNRRPGQGSYSGQVYNGYSKNPSNDAGTGCMQVSGYSGGCYHNSGALCGGSLAKVSAAHVRVAMDDPADPCGIDQFLQEQAAPSISALSTKNAGAITVSIHGGTYIKCGLKVMIPASLASQYSLGFGIQELPQDFCAKAFTYKTNAVGAVPGLSTTAFESELTVEVFNQAVEIAKNIGPQIQSFTESAIESEIAAQGGKDMFFIIANMSQGLIAMNTNNYYTNLSADDKAIYAELASFAKQTIDSLNIEDQFTANSGIEGYAAITTNENTAAPSKSALIAKSNSFYTLYYPYLASLSQQANNNQNNN